MGSGSEWHLSNFVLPCFIFIFYINSAKMGNGAFQIPENLQKQWVDRIRDNRTLFTNKITRQEFEWVDISEKEARQHLKSLVERSTYAIPKTPKIILLKNDKGDVCLLAQCFSRLLSKYISTILNASDLLELLREMASVVESLYAKYGPFTLTEGMVGLTKNRQLVIWINEIVYRTEVQYELQGGEFPERKMIGHIVGMVKRSSPFPLEYECLVRPPRHFAEFICSLTQLINHIKRGRSINKTEAFKKIFSPKKEMRLIQSIEGQSVKEQMTVSEDMKKNGRIPNFIKELKKNKTALLTNIKHRRTVSINRQKCCLAGLNKKNSLAPSLNFKSLDKLKSHREAVSPRGRFETNPNSKAKDYKGQTLSPLTASGVSSGKMVKKISASGREDFKLNLRQLPKTIKQFQPSSTTNVSTVKEQSFLLRSGNRVPQNLKRDVPLISLCANVSESKYFTEEEKYQLMREEEERKERTTKTIEEEFGLMLASGTRSPCANFSGCETQLMQQLAKLMN